MRSKSHDVLLLVVLMMPSFAAAAAWQQDSRAERVRVYPGAEMFAVAAEEVTELDYQAGKRKLSGTRPVHNRGRFLITVTGLRKAERQKCHSGKVFESMLSNLSSVRAKRLIEGDEAAAIRQQYDGKTATLKIRAGPKIDPILLKVILVEGADRQVILLDGPVMYESSLSPKFIDRLSVGCPALSSNSVD